MEHNQHTNNNNNSNIDLKTDLHIDHHQNNLNRPITNVAVGILIRADGAFLLTSRPKGKPYEGYWEFPGGKIENNESVEQALYRELQEELGIEIEIKSTSIFKITQHDYPHAFVCLHWCKIFNWKGEFEMRENQEMAWQTLPLTVSPVLPATLPILDDLGLLTSSKIK